MAFITLYITHESEAQAKEFSEILLQKKWIACANIFPVKSAYWWEGNIQDENEWVSLLKSRKENRDFLMQKISELHPYDVPCIMVTNVRANLAYENWIINSCIDMSFPLEEDFVEKEDTDIDIPPNELNKVSEQIPASGNEKNPDEIPAFSPSPKPGNSGDDDFEKWLKGDIDFFDTDILKIGRKEKTKKNFGIKNPASSGLSPAKTKEDLYSSIGKRKQTKSEDDLDILVQENPATTTTKDNDELLKIAKAIKFKVSEIQFPVDVQLLNKNLLNKLILYFINQARSGKDLHKLSHDYTLYHAALDQNNYQIFMGKLIHVQYSNNKKTVQERIAFYGGRFKMVAENVQCKKIPLTYKEGSSGITYLQLAKSIVDNWLQSGSHYNNIMQKDFYTLGIASDFSSEKNAVFITMVMASMPEV